MGGKPKISCSLVLLRRLDPGERLFLRGLSGPFWFTRFLVRFDEVVRAQRFRNTLFFTQPFTEIDKPATLRTKRAVRGGKPVAGFLASGAFDSKRSVHSVNTLKLEHVGELVKGRG
jgi:hypothetical protein